MGLFGSSEQKKREKKLHDELKKLQKSLVARGCDKRRAADLLKSFGETVIYADVLQKNYNLTRNSIGSSIARIDSILNILGEADAATEKQELKSLTGTLETVYHEALIRPDDADFISTAKSLKKLAIEYCREREGSADATGSAHGSSGMAGVGRAAEVHTTGWSVTSGASSGSHIQIMLRSELENAYSVLSDAYGWSAPDFMALAYCLGKKPGDKYADMENDKRNADILAFYRSDFLQEFDALTDRAGESSHVNDIVAEYAPELKK